MSETGTVQRDVLHCADCGWLVLIKKHTAVRDKYRCNLWRDMVTGEPGDCHTLRTTEAFCGKKATEFKPPTLEEMAQHKDWDPLNLPPAVAVGAPARAPTDPEYDQSAEDEGRRCPECGREVEESRRDGMLHLQCPERVACGWAAYACEVEGCAGLLARFSTRLEKIVRACNVNASHPEFPEAATKPVPLASAPGPCTWEGCQGTVALMGGKWRCSYSQAHKVPVQAEASQPCTATGANCTCGHSHP